MALLKKKLMRQTWYPRPHNGAWNWNHGIETGVANEATIFPIAFYDEGLGAPSAYNAHPEHASFAETFSPNCFPDSRVNSVILDLEFALTKGAIETDGLHGIRCAFMPIFTSFGTELDEADEKSTETIKTILELATESTDRQTYPLYNDIKMVEKFTGSATFAAIQFGLTASQVLEGVAFSSATYYDALQYYTNGGLLKKLQGGLKWFTLTRNKTFKKFRIHIRPKVKRMNPYTFFGIMTYVPKVGSSEQMAVPADTTNISHVNVSMNPVYNEWHQNFDMEKL